MGTATSQLAAMTASSLGGPCWTARLRVSVRVWSLIAVSLAWLVACGWLGPAAVQ